MTIRVDPYSWIAGSVVVGNPGFGVLGSAIPATGDKGPSYLYNDLVLPADANKELCGRIVIWPTSGTIYCWEDGSFDYSNSIDGSFFAKYQLYEDGIAISTPATVALVVGVNVSNLVVPLFTNTNVFYSPTVSLQSVQALYPPLFVNTNTFYSLVVGNGQFINSTECGVIPFENRTGVIQ